MAQINLKQFIADIREEVVGTILLGGSEESPQSMFDQAVTNALLNQLGEESTQLSLPLTAQQKGARTRKRRAARKAKAEAKDATGTAAGKTEQRYGDAGAQAASAAL